MRIRLKLKGTIKVWWIKQNIDWTITSNIITDKITEYVIITVASAFNDVKVKTGPIDAILSASVIK